MDATHEDIQVTDPAKRSSLAWSEDLATGVPSIDQQHQALFGCVGELERAAAERTMLSTFHAMEQLNRYAREHFAEEERLMRLHSYPQIDEHMEEHRQFTHRLFELRRVYLDHDISTELIAMLRTWLEEHVLQTDMGYVPYLTDMGEYRMAEITWQEEAR